MRDRILFEKIPSSQRWLSVIVNAMRAGKVIEMTYQSFWRDEPNTYKAKPYCLKLFKQRWYMLAKSEGKDTPRIYSLDERMIDVKPTDENYMLPAKFNAEEYFNDYFGIIVGTEWAPQEIKIDFAVLPAANLYFLYCRTAKCWGFSFSSSANIISTGF